MRCKIVRFQRLMWCNMMKLTKNKKISVLHYSRNYGRSIPVPRIGSSRHGSIGLRVNSIRKYFPFHFA